MKKRIVKIEEVVSYDQLLQDLRDICEEKGRPKASDGLEGLLTISETSKFFKVSPRTLLNWSEKKILSRISVGNRVYFREKAIQELLQRNEL